MVRMTLKAARVNAGLTQTKAAKELGVSNKTLWSWENGFSVPKADKLDKICSLYGVEYDNIKFFLNNNSL